MHIIARLDHIPPGVSFTPIGDGYAYILDEREGRLINLSKKTLISVIHGQRRELVELRALPGETNEC